LNELVKKCYDALGLISFSPLENRRSAPGQYTGFLLHHRPQELIHQIFDKNFIAADVVSMMNFVRFGGVGRIKGLRVKNVLKVGTIQ
jgi:hypothetical protein